MLCVCCVRREAQKPDHNEFMYSNDSYNQTTPTYSSSHFNDNFRSGIENVSFACVNYIKRSTYIPRYRSTTVFASVLTSISYVRLLVLSPKNLHKIFHLIDCLNEIRCVQLRPNSNANSSLATLWALRYHYITTEVLFH